jgi:hypothetical protein
LLPKRPFTLLVLALSALCAIVGLQALYGTLFAGQLPLPEATLSACDLSRTNSMAGWLSSLWLAWAAAVGAVIYSLRRHRVDDYRGRYRLWIWLSIALLIASLESVAGLRVTLVAWLAAASGARAHIEDTTLRHAALGALGAALMIRGGIEMRRSLGAALALGAAACGYASVLGLLLLETFPPCTFRVMLHSSLLLGSHFLVLFSVLLYARYVYLDAHGQIAPRRRRQPKQVAAAPQEPAAERAPEASEPAAPVASRQPAPDTASPPAPKVPPAPKAPVRAAAPAAPLALAAKNALAARSSAAAQEADDSRKLSKSERKRLKKEMRRQFSGSDV